MKFAASILPALLFLFSAYASSGADAGQTKENPPSPQADVQKVEVVVDSYSFDPDTIKVTAGKPSIDTEKRRPSSP
jgi:hypothetical protein